MRLEQKNKEKDSLIKTLRGTRYESLEREQQEKERTKKENELKNIIEIKEIIEKELPKLKERCNKIAKKGGNKITVMELKDRHLRNDGFEQYDVRRLSNEMKKEGWLKHYTRYITDQSMLRLITILEEKGFRVEVEANCQKPRHLHDNDDNDPWPWFTAKAFLTAEW